MRSINPKGAWLVRRLAGMSQNKMKKPLKILMIIAGSLVLAGVLMTLVVNTIQFFPYKGEGDGPPMGI